MDKNPAPLFHKCTLLLTACYLYSYYWSWCPWPAGDSQVSKHMLGKSEHILPQASMEKNLFLLHIIANILVCFKTIFQLQKEDCRETSKSQLNGKISVACPIRIRFKVTGNTGNFCYPSLSTWIISDRQRNSSFFTFTVLVKQCTYGGLYTVRLRQNIPR